MQQTIVHCKAINTHRQQATQDDEIAYAAEIG
jgi:hypothetical protein